MEDTARARNSQHYRREQEWLQLNNGRMCLRVLTLIELHHGINNMHSTRLPSIYESTDTRP